MTLYKVISRVVVQLRHKKLMKESKLILHLTPNGPSSEVFSGYQDHSSTWATPGLELLSRQCQQQLLETADTVISVHNTSLCLGFLITHLEDRKRTLTRVTRLRSTLGLLLLPGGHLPKQAFFRHTNGNSQIVSWPWAWSPFHSSFLLCVQHKTKPMTHLHLLVLSTCFFSHYGKCVNLSKVLFFFHLFFSIFCQTSLIPRVNIALKTAEQCSTGRTG
jgi:hypothetical protein